MKILYVKDEYHRELKERAARAGISLRDYTAQLIISSRRRS